MKGVYSIACFCTYHLLSYFVKIKNLSLVLSFIHNIEVCKFYLKKKWKTHNQTDDFHQRHGRM